MTVVELFAWLMQQPAKASVHVQIGYDPYGEGPIYQELELGMCDCYKAYDGKPEDAQVTLGY